MSKKLSIIKQPIGEMGKQAISNLLDLKNDKKNQVKKLQNEFIIGESCGCTK